VTPRLYTITATGVTTTSGLAVSYTGAENLAINAGVLSDTFNVRSTAAGTRTTLNGGDEGDTFNVGSTAGTLDDIQGTLTLNGGAQGVFGRDEVNFLDQGSTVGHSYVLRTNSVARSGAAVIVFSGMEQLALNAGSAADGVTVVSTAAGTPLTLNMGAGNDVVNLGTTTTPINALVTVDGGAGTDSVVLNHQGDQGIGIYYITATDVTRGFDKILN